MSRGRLRVDPEAVGQARDAMTRHGLQVGDLPPAVRQIVGQVTGGAGELAGELANDAAGFELSWTVGLDTMSTSLGNVAANIGGFSVDLVQVDLDLSD